MPALDVRSPWVLDVSPLERRAGAMFTKQLEVTAPAELGNDVIGIPPSDPINVDVMAESVIDGVLATFDIVSVAVGNCSRCLTDVRIPVRISAQELYRYEPDPELDGDEMLVEGELIDLQPVVRDAIVLDLPLAPLCVDDCLGLCPQCGVDLNEAEPGHHHEIRDERWAVLNDLLTNGDDKGRTEEEAG